MYTKGDNMISKICNHCGRLYQGTACPCQKKRRKDERHNQFYDSPHWKALARQIKARDLYTDRLALYFARTQEKGEGHINTLRLYLTTPEGQIKAFTDLLQVHHIIPVNEDESGRYKEENLITLYKSTHEYIHQLYKTEEKEAIQNLLRKAIAMKL